jgi:dienelactone hydrolase
VRTPLAPARLAARALAALALSGCAAGAPPLAVAQPSAPAPGVEVREVALQGGFLHVALKIPHAPPGRKPVIIGALADEASLLADGFAIARLRHDWSVLGGLHEKGAEAGSGAAEPDRVGQWMLAAPRPGLVGRDYFAVIGVHAHESIPAAVDWLETQPDVDPRRIAIAGSSTNGFVALEALEAEPRLAGGVIRSACGDYHAFLRSSSLALADDPRWLPDGRLVLDPDYEKMLDAREPIRFTDALPPRPLLMLNGTEDRAVPFACAERTAEVLRAAYARAGAADRFRFVTYSGAGHDLGADARVEALRWWERWLLPGSDAQDPPPAREPEAPPPGSGAAPPQPGVAARAAGARASR